MTMIYLFIFSSQFGHWKSAIWSFKWRRHSQWLNCPGRKGKSFLYFEGLWEILLEVSGGKAVVGVGQLGEIHCQGSDGTQGNFSERRCCRHCRSFSDNQLYVWWWWCVSKILWSRKQNPFVVIFLKCSDEASTFFCQEPSLYIKKKYAECSTWLAAICGSMCTLSSLGTIVKRCWRLEKNVTWTHPQLTWFNIFNEGGIVDGVYSPNCVCIVQINGNETWVLIYIDLEITLICRVHLFVKTQTF